MIMHDTHRLLREFRKSRSEDAFAELVDCYIDLVYSVAIRRVGGNVHRARDIVQTVFTEVSHKTSDDLLRVPYDLLMMRCQA